MREHDEPPEEAAPTRLYDGFSGIRGPPWAAARTAYNAKLSGSRYTGRPGVRPVRKEFDNAACGPSGSLAPTETTRL